MANNPKEIIINTKDVKISKEQLLNKLNIQIIVNGKLNNFDKNFSAIKSAPETHESGVLYIQAGSIP